jgi:hypothetical protein
MSIGNAEASFAVNVDMRVLMHVQLHAWHHLAAAHED